MLRPVTRFRALSLRLAVAAVMTLCLLDNHTEAALVVAVGIVVWAVADLLRPFVPGLRARYARDERG